MTFIRSTRMTSTPTPRKSKSPPQAVSLPHALRPKSPAKRRASKTTDDDIFGKYKPDPHQAVSLKHADGTPTVLDFSDAGTGKTPVALWSFAQRHREGVARCALVICPRTLMTNVWVSSVRKFTPWFTAVAAKAENRAKVFAQEADIYVTNTDAVNWLAKQPKSFFARFTDLFVDECSAFKHHTSQRSKNLAKIRSHFERRRLMSGTPTSRSITDVWHQAFLVDNGKRLGNSFYAFRNSVSTPKQVGSNANALRWDDKEGAEDAVFGLLADIVVRHKFDDVVKIPERQVYTVPYTLSPKHMLAYSEMEKRQVLLYQDKKAMGTVSAIHAASMRTKLLQIASGAVYADMTNDSDRPTHVLDTGRYELALDLALESPHTLIMFLWRHQRDLLTAEAEKRSLNFAVLDGDADDKLRDEIEAAYQAGVYDVVIAHPKTVAHGLTLTRGTTTIWTSPTDDTEWFKQGNRRQARRGQTKATRIITLIGEGTVDEAAYENCIGKGKREDMFLGLFEKYTTEEIA